MSPADAIVIKFLQIHWIMFRWKDIDLFFFLITLLSILHEYHGFLYWQHKWSVWPDLSFSFRVWRLVGLWSVMSVLCSLKQGLMSLFPHMYIFRVSLYISITHRFSLPGFFFSSPKPGIHKSWFFHRLSYHLDLKKLVEETPSFNKRIFVCALMSARAQLRCLLLPWWFRFQYSPGVPLRNSTQNNITYSCENDVSCLSRSHPQNTFISRNLQSQVPECLAKPCPPAGGMS